MHIKTIRYGHANNSSSSHSLIFAGDKHITTDPNYDDYYGWQDFTLADRHEKAMYLMTMLQQNFRFTHYNRAVLLEVEGAYKKFDNYEANKITEADSYTIGLKYMRDNFSSIFTEQQILEWEENRKDSGIDHESVITLPKTKDGDLHCDFIRKLFGLILDENYIILGGNDNSEGHPLKDEHVETPMSQMIRRAYERSGCTCIYDDVNNDYVLLYERGDKFRVCFDVNNTSTTKTKFPELVDLKITDFCAYGCAFCYQSSTTQGRHAPLDDINRIVQILKNSNCMEVAIGGGEPTTHPQFHKILSGLNWDANMLVGFTTRNFGILDHPEINWIRNNTNSIAFSCMNEREAEDVVTISQYIQETKNNYGAPKVYVQIILELMSEERLQKIFNLCSQNRVPVTLLGYKSFGFGKTYSPKYPKAPERWIQMVKDSGAEVGCDSVIVENYHQELLDAGVDPRAMVGKEGKFSCYVDAVAQTMGPSSFTDQREPFPMEADDILEQYKKY